MDCFFFCCSDKQTGENGREHVDFCGACAVFTSGGFLNMDVLDILLKNMEIFQIIQLMVPLWLMNKDITPWAPNVSSFTFYLVQVILLHLIVEISSFPPLHHCVVTICFLKFQTYFCRPCSQCCLTISIFSLDSPIHTPEPTYEPTQEPTHEPTHEPTAKPTRNPTVEPTITVTPTRGMFYLFMVKCIVNYSCMRTDSFS